MSTEATKRTTKKAIDEAEASYEHLWGILGRLKKGEADARLMQFQPELCETLFKLSRSRAKIAMARQRLLARKRSVSRPWFLKRMRSLARHEKTLNLTIGIGQSLGDAFAWMFYQKDPALLADHLTHPRNQISSGVGGVGELEFIRNTPILNGMLVLLHGTTSILRIGDCSLVDMETLRVKALGELKAGPLHDGQITVECQFVGARSVFEVLPSEATESRPNEVLPVSESLSASARQRLERQKDRMFKAAKRIVTDIASTTIETDENYYIAQLSAVLKSLKRGAKASVHLGGGLSVFVVRHRCPTLFGRLTTEMKRLVGQPNRQWYAAVAALACENSVFNVVRLGSLQYDAKDQPYHLPGAVPVAWWDLEPEHSRAIVIRDVVVVTLFNPAHLIEALKKRGFAVTPVNPPTRFLLRRRIGQQDTRTRIGLLSSTCAADVHARSPS